MEDPEQIVFRLLLVGNADVGKTSILSRYAQDPFADTYPDVEQKTRTLQMNGKTVNVVLVDTGGQERFRALTSGTYRGIDGIYICYDVTRKDTFDDIGEWLNELNRYAKDRKVERFLLGNKIDLLSSGGERKVTEEQGQEAAAKHGMTFFETSAKDDTNIETSFTTMISKLLEAHTTEAAPVEAEKKGCCVIQ